MSEFRKENVKEVVAISSLIITGLLYIYQKLRNKKSKDRKLNYKRKRFYTKLKLFFNKSNINISITINKENEKVTLNTNKEKYKKSKIDCNLEKLQIMKGKKEDKIFYCIINHFSNFYINK